MSIISKLKWFYPGMKIKRYVIFIPVGLICVILGTALFVNQTYDYIIRRIGRFAFDIYGINVGNIYQLFFLGCFFLVLGLLIIFIVMKQILESVVSAVSPGRSSDKSHIVDSVFKNRFLASRPSVVVIGGGTGLSTMLRGLKQQTSNITAIVTVSDDGGSSGRLKNEMGIMPPGDIRNCLIALADVEDDMENLLQYRFKTENKDIDGHSFGNLMIAAMTSVSGDFVSGIQKLSHILAVRGSVYPCSITPIELVATFEDDTTLTGETKIVESGKKIKKIELNNKNASPSSQVTDAIMQADLIVFGPGSLYTSVIPNLLVKDIKDAVIKSKAKKVYVCNVMTQPGETDGFNAYDHFSVIKKYLDNENIDFCFVNNAKPDEKILRIYSEKKQEYVEYDPKNFRNEKTKIIADDFMDKGDKARHNYEILAKRIIRLVIK